MNDSGFAYVQHSSEKSKEVPLGHMNKRNGLANMANKRETKVQDSVNSSLSKYP